MTKNEALYECLEIAMAVIHRSQSDAEDAPELFTIARIIQDEVCAKVDGVPFSPDYEKAYKWIQGNRQS